MVVILPALPLMFTNLLVSEAEMFIPDVGDETTGFVVTLGAEDCENDDFCIEQFT